MGQVYMICDNIEFAKGIVSTMASLQDIIIVTSKEAKKIPLAHNRPKDVFEFTAPAILPSLSLPKGRRERRKEQRKNK